DAGDILVVVTGEEDIQATVGLIKERCRQANPDAADRLIVLQCYSAMQQDQQLLIMNSAPPGFRKCIVATNIVETSVTINGLRFVIDCGFHKCKVFRPNLGMNVLQVFPVSKAQAAQRKGRAGRTQAGVCFRLYTEDQHNDELLDAP